MAFPVQTNGGVFKINDVPMRTPAWKLDWHPVLLDSPLRGEYITIPGQDGADPVPLRESSAQHSLRFWLCGDVDHNGDPYAASGGYSAEWVGFISNLNYLRTNVLTGRTLTGNRTRSATIALPGGGSLSADVHCWLPPGTWTKHVLETTLELRIPDGAFT